jgi:hypothetical protein
VAKLAALTSLKVAWCEQITDASLGALLKLSVLTSIRLDSTNTTDNGRQQLQRSLPLLVLNGVG